MVRLVRGLFLNESRLWTQLRSFYSFTNFVPFALSAIHGHVFQSIASAKEQKRTDLMFLITGARDVRIQTFRAI